MRKGMILTVLRPATGKDFTNGGPSSKATEILVVSPGLPEIFEERPDRPTFELAFFGDYKFLRPVEPCPSDRAGYMFGGNFAYVTDDRWKFGALPLHDRTEGSEQCGGID